MITDNARTSIGDGVGLGPINERQDVEDVPAAKPAGQTDQPPAATPGRNGEVDLSRMTPAEQEAERERLEKAAFEQAAQQIRDAVGSDPALADLVKQLAIDMTPEGLRIQIMDEVKLPMFPSGSAEPNERVRLLMQKIVPVLLKLSEPISITGHTDAAPFRGPDRTNWELSAERANATRRLLVEDGLPEARLRSVTGLADREPLLPDDPLAAANRRIAILVLRHIPQATSMAETRRNRS